MGANLKEIRKHRRYSEEFKKSIVASFEKGKFSVLQLEKLYGITMPAFTAGFINIPALMKKAVELWRWKTAIKTN